MRNIDEYSIFGGETEYKAPVKERKETKKLIRTKQAVERYSIGKTKLKELAIEANAFLKIDGLNLYDMFALDRYIETFRVRG